MNIQRMLNYKFTLAGWIWNTLIGPKIVLVLCQWWHCTGMFNKFPKTLMVAGMTFIHHLFFYGTEKPVDQEPLYCVIT